jgi:hypothetical protein
MKTISLRLPALAALLLAPLHAADAPQLSRPKLQIINGSSQTVDIFWLKSNAERVSNGSVAPGKNTVITTTLGHRFEVVGRDDKTTATVTSEVPVQGFRFDPQARSGVLVHRFSHPSPGVITCLFTGTYGSLLHACSQLLSEADLPENHGCPNLLLPDHWSRHVKSALFHVISLAKFACVHTWA